jgi:hypothetical protein
VRTIPISAGKIDLTSYESSGKDAIKEFGAYIVNSHGVKYKHREGKHLIIYMGVRALTHSAFTADHITALLFHELGHSFVEFTTGYSIGLQKIAKEIAIIATILSNANSFIKTADTLVKLKPIPYILKIINIPCGNITNAPDAVSPLEALPIKKAGAIVYNTLSGLVKFIGNIIKNSNTLLTQLTFSKMSNSIQLETAKKQMLDGTFIVNDREALEMLYAVIEKQLRLIGETIIRIVALSPSKYVKKVFLAPLKHLITPIRVAEELSADSFTAVYGLAPAFAEALILRDKVFGKHAMRTSGIFEITNNVPVLNAVVQMPMLILITLNALCSGYPSEIIRTKALHLRLKKELANSDLPKKLKSALEDDLDMVAKIYNDNILPQNKIHEREYAKAAVYYVVRFITKFCNISNGAGKTPDPVTTRTGLLSIWSGDSDIPALFKFNSEQSALFADMIRELPVSHINGESDDLLDYSDEPDDLSFETSLNNENGNAVNRIAYESFPYFGKNVVVLKTIDFIADLRKAIIPKNAGADLSTLDKHNVRAILHNMGEYFAKCFKVKEVYITLYNKQNCEAVPLYLATNTEIENISSAEMVVGLNGFRFKNGENVIIITRLGIEILCKPQFSNNMIAAMLFHEFGHSFEDIRHRSLITLRNKTEFFKILKTLNNCLSSSIDPPI